MNNLSRASRLLRYPKCFLVALGISTAPTGIAPAFAAEDLLTAYAIESIRLVGEPTVLQQALQAIIHEYENRTLYYEDFVALRDRVRQLYVENGYISSGAVIPSQSATDLQAGIFTLEIVEGQVPEPAFRDARPGLENALQRIYREQLHNPLNVNELENLVAAIEGDYRVDVVRGSLIPGATPGGSSLELLIEEADMFFLDVGANNHLSPSVGSEQAFLALAHQDLTGHADRLALSLNKSEGVEGASIAYSIPLPGSGFRINALYSLGDTVVVEEPFDAIDVQSDTDTAALALSRQFSLSESSSLIAEAGLETKNSKTFLLGQPFDFSPGSIAGETKASIATLALEFRQQSRDQAFSARATWRHGMDRWGATIKQGLPDGRFDSLVSQLQYVTRVPRIHDEALWSLGLNAQLTRDSLQSFERFSIGGHDSVRGYRENQLLKDNAWEVMTELQMPMPGLPEFDDFDVILKTFAAHGRGWNSVDVPNVTRSGELGSIGLGTELRGSGWTVALDWAQRLNRKGRQGDELQDHGFHIGVRYGF